MRLLVESLPSRVGKEKEGHLYIIDTKFAEEKNVAEESTVQLAKEKNWGSIDYADGEEKPYEGSKPEKKMYRVILESSARGSITYDGYQEGGKNEVPANTSITIKVTPVEGFELLSLTANGKDILESKTVVITEDTRIKALFGIHPAVEEVQEKINLISYPNPFTSFLELRIPTVLVGKTLSIYKANGKCVKQILMKEEKFRINTEDYPRGYYILRIGTYSQVVLK